MLRQIERKPVLGVRRPADLHVGPARVDGVVAAFDDGREAGGLDDDVGAAAAGADVFHGGGQVGDAGGVEAVGGAEDFLGEGDALGDFVDGDDAVAAGDAGALGVGQWLRLAQGSSRRNIP